MRQRAKSRTKKGKAVRMSGMWSDSSKEGITDKKKKKFKS
jgi:hypothetical protein